MHYSTIINKLKGRKPFVLGHENFQQSAVLVPLIEKNNETHILFEVRSMKLRTQPGDICFPGGRIEKEDPNQQFTALRETSEELGISKNLIKEIVPLDYVVSHFNGIIYPFVGVITHPELIRPSEAEVAEVFTVPLSFFMNTEPEQHNINFNMKPCTDFPLDLIVGGENYDWQTPIIEELFYTYNKKVIWGLTAKILTHFIELIKK